MRVHSSGIRTLLASGFLAFTAACAGLLPHTAQAQTTTIIVPYAAGGTTDLLARQAAEAISKHTGRTVIVDNKPGAGGYVGARMVTRAKPDGQTLLMTSSGITAVTPQVYPDYHPMRDLDHVSIIVDVPFVLVARKDLGIDNAQQFLEHARKTPGVVSMGNAGIGTHGHLVQIMLSQASNLDFSIVPYKGSVPAANDLLGSHLDSLLDNVGVQKPFIDAGKVVPLFVTSKERVPSLPNVPTAREVGVPFDSVAWFGLAAPKGTSPEFYAQIVEALQIYFNTPALTKQHADAGMTVVISSPEAADKRARQDTEVLGALARQLNLKP